MNKNDMKMRSFLLIVGILFTLTGCYKEDDITPSDDYSASKFTFPQGNDVWDTKIKEIHDKYGVFLIYKDVTVQDLNRQWTSLGTDPRLLYGDDLNGQQVQFYLNFLAKNIFAFLTPEFAQKVLPVKIYMLGNLRKHDPNSGGTGTGGTGTGGTGTGGTGTGGTTDPNFVPFKTDGFDYWAISFTASEMSYLNPYSEKIKRSLFLSKMLIKAISKEILTEPADFRTGINYEKEILSQDFESGEADYYKNRGFIKMWDADFQQEFILNYISFYSSSSMEEFPHVDFICYIRAALYYTKEEFRAKYPVDQYPLINTRYDIVVNHLKTKYSIDLEQIAKGTKE